MGRRAAFCQNNNLEPTMAIQRQHGAEHPYWPLGPFKIRLPFIH